MEESTQQKGRRKEAGRIWIVLRSGLPERRTEINLRMGVTAAGYQGACWLRAA